MSVIIKSGNKYFIFPKGTPESIELHSRPNTVPLNFYSELYSLAKRGLRIIGLGFKEITKKDLEKTRKVLQADMTFLGLYLFENELRDKSYKTIKTLTKKK